MEEYLTMNEVAGVHDVQLAILRTWVFMRKILSVSVGSRFVVFEPNAIAKFLRVVPALHHKGAPDNWEGSRA
jgi:hypothetical protein